MSEGTANDTAFETKASGMGWVPVERFRGDKEKWVDAKTFVERGEQFLPILQANNRRLQEEHQRTLDEVTALKATIAESTAAVEELKRFHTESTRAAVEATKKSLLKQLAQAKKDEDVDAEVSLTDQLSEVNIALREEKARPEAKPAVKQESTSNGLDPAFVTWQALPENAWFGKDRRKTNLAIAIAQDLRAAGDRSMGASFYDKVAAEVEVTMGGDGGAKAAPDKVGASRGGQSNSSGDAGGRSYKDLPADARAACDHQSAKLVGEGKPFKTKTEWQTYYAEQYSWE